MDQFIGDTLNMLVFFLIAGLLLFVTITKNSLDS